eukprot:CAMPEP_0114319486 /NCGR_PEP_ID=MMETSP0059-20121206/25269_1 /TAXON_ID=36894 /ORGANISM="Pyramimonas parkeae, Strain CCMP726" /LENGTH=1029 /DNA_ID=CAMNT_0001446501 /DNA_START=179 /DNA_END=3265 /DNA_ORIENTATION=+
MFPFALFVLLAHLAFADATGPNRASIPNCAGVPHRVRYKCYASQLLQSASGTRTRGRVLKEGLPPVFDYEVDEAEKFESVAKVDKEQASESKQTTQNGVQTVGKSGETVGEKIEDHDVGEDDSKMDQDTDKDESKPDQDTDKDEHKPGHDVGLEDPVPDHNDGDVSFFSSNSEADQKDNKTYHENVDPDHHGVGLSDVDKKDGHAQSNNDTDLSSDDEVVDYGAELDHYIKDKRQEVEKDWIVVWDETQVSTEDVRRVCDAGLAGTNKTCQRKYSTAVTGFSARLTLSELEGVLSEYSAQIKYAERDQVVSAVVVNQTTKVPWGLDRIDSRSGRSGTYQYLNTGEGVNVYVIDTGVRITHDQFGFLNGSVGTRAQHGYDAIDNDNIADDCQGHGTHVAGSAAGKDYGVAKDARVHAVRVLDCYGSGSTQSVVAGIDWTETNHIKPAVATMSLGGSASVSLDEATAALVAAGVTVAVAAGNNAGDACFKSPAREPTALTVGASDERDGGAYFTNYGTCVDLFAPGTNVLSADYGSDTSTSSKSGTSMSTPYVAGVVALFLQSNPTATPEQASSDVLDYCTRDILTGIGTGSPNKLLYSFVYSITSAPTSPTTSPTSSPTSPTTSPTSTPTSPTASPTTFAPTVTDPVPNAIRLFDSSAPSILNGLSSLYDFSDGTRGTCISDGGYDMYDCGNQIYVKATGTSSYTGPLAYRQSVSSAATGSGDVEYTTYKSTTPGSFIWLAMFYSPVTGIESFKVDGNNGADGGGTATWGSLGVSTVDSRYYGWNKKVVANYDPSINHLIIAPGSSWTQSSTSNTNSDLHTLTKVNGTGASTVYYLLWAGRTGSYGYSYSTSDFRSVMNAFLDAVGTTTSPTSPTTSPTAAPTSPTTSPTAAPTSPTTSPTTAAPTAVPPTSDAKAGSGLPDRQVYCDMEEDGGGWMLLYSYNRVVSTNRALDGTELPTSPTTGYSHWHVGPALGYTSPDDLSDVRFYCNISHHSRVMHFKTSNRHIRSVAVSGRYASGNSASYWNTGWT